MSDDRAREQMTPLTLGEYTLEAAARDVEAVVPRVMGDHKAAYVAAHLRRLAALERGLAALVKDGGPLDLRLQVMPKTGPDGTRMWFAGCWRFGSDYAEEGGCWALTPGEALVRLAEALEAGDG